MRKLAVLLLVVWAAVAVAQGRKEPSPKIEPVKYAELADMIRTDSGKAVVVNFWASWCKPCKEEMPALLRLQKSFDDGKFSLILISADDEEDLESDVRPTLKKLGVDFTTYIARDSYESFVTAMNPQWKGALALPMTFIYNPKGNLADFMFGGKEFRDFNAAVAKAMK